MVSAARVPNTSGDLNPTSPTDGVGDAKLLKPWNAALKVGTCMGLFEVKD